MERWNRLRRFLQDDIWAQVEAEADRQPPFLLRLLRILLLATRGITENSLQLRASALVYYSLLSVVPVVALMFGVAKGFGLENALEHALQQRLAGQEEILEQVLTFARNLLADTRGGVVAGVGVAFLIWTVIRLLSNIERSFNAIWGEATERSLVRKLTDYLAITLVAPILLLISSSATVFISGRVNAALATLGVFEPVGVVVRGGLELVPYLFIWLLLTLLYMAMPNTAVSWRAGLAAGVVAGTLFQLLQVAYIDLQIGVSRNNAIYGSFAALPLFLIWLHFSWLIVLVGAEVSFAVDNAGDYARERHAAGVSHYQRRLVAVVLAAMCADRFVNDRPAASAAELAEELQAPTRLVHAVLCVLAAAGTLVEVRRPKPRASCYQPAHDPSGMTLVEVAEAYDRAARPGSDETTRENDDAMVSDAALGETGTRWRALSEAMLGSGDNLTLLELVAPESAGQSESGAS